MVEEGEGGENNGKTKQRKQTSYVRIMNSKQRPHGHHNTVRIHVQGFSTYSLPVPLLLARLVRVERAPIRATLGVAKVSLGALALRLLSLLSLRTASLARGKPLRIEAALAGLLHATAALRTLADPDPGADVLNTDITTIGLVRVLRRSRSGTLAERRSRSRGRALAEAHEALHALTATAIQATLLVLAVLARRKSAADVHILANGVLRMVLVTDVIVRVRMRLLTVQALAIR